MLAGSDILILLLCIILSISVYMKELRVCIVISAVIDELINEILLT